LPRHSAEARSRSMIVRISRKLLRSSLIAPESDHDEIETALRDHEASLMSEVVDRPKLLDPNWGLERMISNSPGSPEGMQDPFPKWEDPLELGDLGERFVVEQHRELSCGRVVHRRGGLLGLGDVTPSPSTAKGRAGKVSERSEDRRGTRASFSERVSQATCRRARR